MHNAVAGEPGTDTAVWEMLPYKAMTFGSLERPVTATCNQPICNKMSAGIQSRRLLLSASASASVFVTNTFTNTLAPEHYYIVHVNTRFRHINRILNTRTMHLSNLDPLVYIQSILCSYFWVYLYLQCTNLDPMFTPSAFLIFIVYAQVLKLDHFQECFSCCRF